jgi:hypothetical protein
VFTNCRLCQQKGGVSNFNRPKIRYGLSDIKEDLAFMIHCRGNPPKVGVEDCMSMGGIKMLGTFFTIEAPKVEERQTRADPQTPRE